MKKLEELNPLMLDRIVHAPTEIHRDMSVVLIMPFLREKLRREKP